MNHISKAKKLLAALIMLAVPAGTTALIAAPAEAVGYGIATAKTVAPGSIANSQCVQHYYTVDTYTDDYTYYAFLTVEIVAPNGMVIENDSAQVDTDYYNQTHSFTANMCGGLHLRGTYTIKPTIKACDGYGECAHYPGTPATFTFTDPAPPPPPPVTPVDVTGSHTVVMKTKKLVKVKFTANALGANQSQRSKLTYSIKAGKKTVATVSLNAGQVVTKRAKVPAGKKTKFTIIKNGVKVQTFKVKGV